MATMQTVVDLARRPMQDDDAQDANRRFPDATLLNYAIHGLLNAYRNRYDLFVNVATPNLGFTLGTTFPLPDEYIEPLANYVTAKAEGHEDEYVNSGRMSLMLQMFSSVVPI